MTARDHDTTPATASVGDARRLALPRVGFASLPSTLWEFLLSPVRGLLAVLLFSFAIYAPSINHYFFEDDFLFLRHAQVTSWHTWFLQSFDYRDPRPVVEFVQYRPLYLMAFRAEYSAFGLSAMPYHLTNLLVHLANVALFWFVARRLTGQVWPAHIAAFVFGAHFAYGDAVRWVVNGNTPLAVLCYLSAFLLFMKFADGGPRRLWHYSAFLIAFSAALLVHAVTVPLAPTLAVWYFLFSRQPRDALRPTAWLPFVPVVAVLTPYLLIQNWVHGHYYGLADAYKISWHMYVSYVHYFALSVYPVRVESSSAAYVSTVMFVSCGFLLTQWRWSPIAVFAVIWYILTIAPDSTSVIGDYGRLLYVGGLPLGLIVAAIAMRLVDLASKEAVLSALARVRRAQPYLGLAAIAVAMLVVWRLHVVEQQAVPIHVYTLSRQSDQNHAFVDQLRASVPAIPDDGTLYVVNPPVNLIIFNDKPLRSLVGLYYGDVNVQVVPLTTNRNSTLEQVESSLRAQDRLFVFHEKGADSPQ